jgi:serine/threonine protein kinase
MSPEQARAEAVDHRSDLFSLGSVLYAMATGHSPLRGDTAMAVLKRVCEDTPRPMRETNPAVPKWLEAIVAKLHAKDPAQRYQSAAEVAEVLGRCLAHVQQPDTVPEPVPPVTPAVKKPPSPQDIRRGCSVLVFLALFIMMGIFACIVGPYSVRWVRNEGVLKIRGGGLIEVKRDGESVASLGDDGFHPQNEHILTLPPGRYEVTLARGSRWHATASQVEDYGNLFTSTATTYLAAQDHWSVDLRRGRQVTIWISNTEYRPAP